MDTSTVVTVIYAIAGTGGILGSIGQFSKISKGEKASRAERDALAAKVLSLEVKMNQLDPDRLTRMDVRMADLSSQAAQHDRFAKEDRAEMDRQISRVEKAVAVLGDAVQALKSKNRATQ